MRLNVTIPLKHVLHCVCFLTWLYIVNDVAIFRVSLRSISDALNDYGFLITASVVVIKLLAFLAVPQTIFNVIGLFFYDAFPEAVKMNNSPLVSPFICVRVVTRGLYPNLVRENVKKNMETLASVGIDHFIIQGEWLLNLNEPLGN
jgi:egghead protein (zeste-white 4 protein)